jgi:hypothetical protein
MSMKKRFTLSIKKSKPLKNIYVQVKLFFNFIFEFIYDPGAYSVAQIYEQGPGNKH